MEWFAYVSLALLLAVAAMLGLYMRWDNQRYEGRKLSRKDLLEFQDKYGDDDEYTHG